MGYQIGYIYEQNGRYLVCLSMDFQTMEVKFKIFLSLDEAQHWVSR